MTLITEGKSILESAITGGLAAAAVASSAALVFIPSVETITLFVFLMGIVLPTKHAFIGAITTAVLFEFVATAAYGPSGFTFYLKLVAWLMVVSFGVLSKSEFKKFKDPSYSPTLFDRLALYGIGAISALLFDAITNLGMLVFLPTNNQSILVVYFVVFLSGITFTTVHVISNSILFLTIPELVRLFYEVTSGLNI